MAKTKWKLQSFLVYALATQVVACVTLVLNISIVRQVVGFLYLILIPGFIILRIFRLDKLDVTELILFSVGLSIAFLMFIGLLINELGSSIFISKPLSTEPLSIIINITVILMWILCCLKNKEDFNIMAPGGLRTSLLIVAYLILPFLSVIGVMLVNAFKNNLVLLLIITVISILFLLSSFSPNFSSYYPLALVSIASILLLNESLVTNYIRGHDMHLDYFIFKETKNISYWNRYKFLYSSYNPIWPLIYNSFNSMLSITMLPTIFSYILNMEETWIFKIIYPLILSLVPLVLYQLYQRQWGKKVAFLAVLFFMSNTVFFNFWNSAKQMIGDLFYLLLFLVLLKKDMNQRSEWIILVCFGFAMIVSYYSMSYMFLFLIFSTWLCAKIFGKNKDKKINSVIVVFFFVLTFSWYMYIVEGAFDRLMVFFKVNFQVFLEEFFYPQSSKAVLTATGILRSPSFLHNIGRILHNVTELFILIGFITLIAKRKKERLDPEYFVLTSLNMILLLIAIITPFAKTVFSMERLYHITLFFVSPLFILGGRTFFENMFKILPFKKGKKRESYSLILILTVLVAFFLFQTGFVYEITGDPFPSSISLSRYRMDDNTRLDLGLVHENDFFGAMWLLRHTDVENAQIYSDVKAKYYVLTSSMINRKNSIIVLSNTTVVTSGSYIYLSRYNTINKVLLYDTRWPIDIRYNISELPIFNSTAVFNNKIYSNSACEIYYYSP